MKTQQKYSPEEINAMMNNVFQNPQMKGWLIFAMILSVLLGSLVTWFAVVDSHKQTQAFYDKAIESMR